MSTLHLSGRVALVTGSGRGIGRAIALKLAAAGSDLILVARTAVELDESARQVRDLGRNCFVAQADVSHREAVDQLVLQALSEFKRIDILVNNAGVQSPIGPLIENDPDEWVRTVSTNLFATFYFMRAVAPGMIAQGRGKIINLSGGGATAPRPNFSAYAASKAAIVRLTETAAEELKRHNIQVNAIAPGAINTRMLDEVLQAGQAAGEEAVDALKRKQQGGMSIESVAELAVFLAGHASDGLTGKLISAPHDAWREWDGERIEDLMSAPWLTLRRMDSFSMRQLQEERERCESQ
jgi:3-oxoacyl-[acyl-carrier protein] reductase